MESCGVFGLAHAIVLCVQIVLHVQEAHQRCIFGADEQLMRW